MPVIYFQAFHVYAFTIEREYQQLFNLLEKQSKAKSSHKQQQQKKLRFHIETYISDVLKITMACACAIII